MKEGLKAVLFDVDDSDEVKLVECEFGIKAYGVIAKLYKKIAKDHGYYAVFTEDVKLMFAGENHVSVNFVDETLKAALRRGVFDKDLYNKYSILTSMDRQEKFFAGTTRRKRINLVYEYLLVSVDDIPTNAHILSLNVDNSKRNAYSLETNKEKQINRNEINTIETEIDDTDTAADPAIAVLHKYEKFIGMVTPTVLEEIDFFISEGIQPELIIRIIEYACEQGKRNWQYIRAAIKGNMDAGIKTLDAYNRAQAERAENAKKVHKAESKNKGKLNNYNDTNKPDYSNFGNEIIKEMLGEETTR